MRTRFAFLAILVAVSAFGATGCEEISARRQMQDANKHFENAKYEDARRLYEDALKRAPDVDIGHHNLGVTYYKLMRRGDSSPENQELARNATKHLQTYLAKHESDEKVRNLMTEIWRETRLYDEAIAFWTARHTANPQDAEPMDVLAGFENSKDNWEGAIGWLQKMVDVAKDGDGQAAAYLQIGKLCFMRLFEGKFDFKPAERVALADRGLAALEKAAKLQPKNGEIVSIQAGINQQRAIAAGSRLGFHIDQAHHQNHIRALNVLKEEAKKAAEQAEQAGGAEAAPAQGGT